MLLYRLGSVGSMEGVRVSSAGSGSIFKCICSCRAADTAGRPAANFSIDLENIHEVIRVGFCDGDVQRVSEESSKQQ